MTEFTVDLSRDAIHVKVKPEDRWDPAELVISCAGTTVRLQVTDEDLEDIGFKIREHLGRKKSAANAS
jgi:hypothetical protein